MLQGTGHYHGQWKQLFLSQKIGHIHTAYCHLPAYRQAEYFRMVKDQIGLDELEYLSQNKEIKRSTRIFYYALLGCSRFAAIENTVRLALRKAEKVLRNFRDKLIRRG
jgi:hypothetical protein